jgi:hypothetical protein
MNSDEIDLLRILDTDPVELSSVNVVAKTYPHVPPRVDPDLYQADVPEWSPPVKGKSHAAVCANVF